MDAEALKETVTMNTRQWKYQLQVPVYQLSSVGGHWPRHDNDRKI
jgi:hypothetical protein